MSSSDVGQEVQTLLVILILLLVVKALPSATGDKQLAIGVGTDRWITGDSSFNVTCGIATVYSTTGIVSATKFCGDGSCLTGLPGFSADAQDNLFAGFIAGNAADSGYVS